MTNAIVAAFDYAGVYIYGFFDEIGAYIQKASIAWAEFWGSIDEEKSAKLKVSVDEQLTKRKEERQQGLEKRAAGRTEVLKNNANERDQFSKDFSKTLREDFARKQKDTTAESPGLKAAQERLAGLQSKVTEKVAQAKTKADDVAAAKEEADRAAKKKQPGESIPPPAQIANIVNFTSGESVGSFSGKATEAAGAVSIQQETKEIMGRLRAIHQSS